MLCLCCTSLQSLWSNVVCVRSVSTVSLVWCCVCAVRLCGLSGLMLCLCCTSLRSLWSDVVFVLHVSTVSLVWCYVCAVRLYGLSGLMLCVCGPSPRCLWSLAGLQDPGLPFIFLLTNIIITWNKYFTKIKYFTQRTTSMRGSHPRTLDWVPHTGVSESHSLRYDSLPLSGKTRLWTIVVARLIFHHQRYDTNHHQSLINLYSAGIAFSRQNLTL